MTSLLEARRRTLSDAYAKANDRLREWLNRRLDDQSLDIAKLYRVDRNRLLFRIRTVYEQYLRDDPTYVRARLTGATYAIDNAITEQVAELARDLNQNAVGALGVLMDMQPEAVQRHLQRYSKLDFKDLPWPSRNVLNELTTGVTGGGTFFDHMSHITDGLKSKITSDVRLSLLNGDTFDDVRDKLMKTFGVDKLAEPKGSAYGSVKVYKNEARRQWNLLMRQQARQAGGDEIWYATIDEASTPGCVARHGRKLSELDGDAPPRHINCRCEIMVIEQGEDLADLRAEADAWLSREGYSRRQAAQMESQHGFPWGQIVLRPLMQIEAAPREQHLYAFRAVQRLAIPRFAAGVVPDGEWYATEELAQAAGDPDSVLVRTSDLQHAPEKAEANTTQGWESLRTHKGTWVETVRGYFLDSPAIGPTWEPRKRRLTLDLIERWPRMRGVTWKGLQPDQVYAVRIMAVTEARAASLGIMPDHEWLTGEDLSATVKLLMAEGFLPGVADPHLAVAIVPVARVVRSSQPGLVVPVVTVGADDVDSIFNLSVGSAIYARDSFDGGLLAPYQRVAVLCFEPDHTVWAVRPRGRFFWALPGGHIEKGETAQLAAQREMEEETGVSVTILASLGVIYRPWSTTTVFLARRDKPVAAPLLPEEIDAAFPVPLENLEDTDRTWVLRKWDFIKASRVLVEGVGKWKKLFQVVEAFDPTLHPHMPAGSPKGGQFAPKGGGVSSPTYKGQAKQIAAAIRSGARSNATIGKLTQRPEYTGKWQKSGYQYGHATEYSLIGEHIVTAVLQQQDSSAHLVKPEGKFSSNYPFDGVERGAAYDVKTSPISTGKDNIDNRQWRYTSDTKGWERDIQKGMSKTEVAQYNRGKADAIVMRKMQAAQDIANVTGKSVRARVYGVIINPSSATSGRADIYKFDGKPGDHARIGWGRVERIKGNYVGTVSYKYKRAKESVQAWLDASPLRETETLTLDHLSDWSKDFWRSRGLLDVLPLPLLVGFDRELERLYQGWIAQLLIEFGDETHEH